MWRILAPLLREAATEVDCDLRLFRERFTSEATEGLFEWNSLDWHFYF